MLHSALVAQRAETSGSTCVTTWREGAPVQTLPHPPTGCDAGTGGQDFASHSRCGGPVILLFLPSVTLPVPRRVEELVKGDQTGNRGRARRPGRALSHRESKGHIAVRLYGGVKKYSRERSLQS